MYNANIAVIKSMLRRLKKDDFIREAKAIKQRALESEPGSKERAKLILILRWCYFHYRSTFQKKPTTSGRAA
jgi:hypothetical protein